MATLQYRLGINSQDKVRLDLIFKRLKRFSTEEVKASLNHIADNTEGRMRQLAPVDTGRLRREILVKVISEAIFFQSEAIDPETKADYAPLQEYGTRHWPAQPYFYPAIRWGHFALVKDLNRRMQNVLRAANRKK